jgi:hypothetical protein
MTEKEQHVWMQAACAALTAIIALPDRDSTFSDDAEDAAKVGDYLVVQWRIRARANYTGGK